MLRSKLLAVRGKCGVAALTYGQGRAGRPDELERQEKQAAHHSSRSARRSVGGSAGSGVGCAPTSLAPYSAGSAAHAPGAELFIQCKP